MKPILFPEGQKDFSTNGLGRLPDAISCKVTEERNGQYELHMEYEYSHDIKKALAHIVLPLDCEKCARIYQDRLVPFLEDCRKELEKN